MINYFLTQSICLAICYSFYAFVLKKESNFQFSRVYLLSSLLMSSLLPFLDISQLFNWTSEINQATEVTLTMNEVYATASQQAAPYFDLKTSLVTLYLAGVSFSLFKLIRQLSVVMKVINRNIKVHKEDYILVKIKDEMPTSSFWNYLIWSEDETLSEKDKNRILLHEKEHIDQKHTLDVMLLELFQVFVWFNPLIQFYKKSLTSIHEYLADRKVAQETGQQGYVKLLARQAIRNFELDTVNYFGKNLTLKRINMMNNKNQNSSVIKYLLMVPLMGILVFAVACTDENEVVPEVSLKEGGQNQDASATGKASIGIESSEVFTKVDDQPYPPGGMEAFYKHLAENLKYPQEARKNNIEARVFVQFVINKEGALTEFEVLKNTAVEKPGDTDYGMNDAAIKAIQSFPHNWNPGSLKGVPVNVRMVLPIVFKF